MPEITDSDKTINASDPQTVLLNQAWYKEWRLLAAYVYLTICSYDFMLAPLSNQLIAYYFKQPFVPWTPLTTQGTGLFHLSFLTILGISAYGKGNERVEMLRNMPDYSNVPLTEHHHD
jgi:hypothetical protein